jgi:AraC family transcriptional regulator
MDMHCLDSSQQNPTEALVIHDDHRRLRATCAVMKVTYYPYIGAAEQDDVKDAIEILIVADHPVFHLRYRCGGRGDGLASRESLLQGGPDADMIVITMDRIYFEHRARAALGNTVPRIAAGYAAADPFMRELGNALLRDFRSGRLPTCPYLESLAGVIAIYLGAHHCECHLAPPASIGLPGHKLNRVLAFIAEHIGEAIRIRDLANMAHMSLHHFARMFKQATGMPPHLYITMQRMERAKTMLRETELALVDIAASVGFQTQGHFTAVFHRHTLVTPRVFRLNCHASLHGVNESVLAANRTIRTWLRKDMEEHGLLSA